MSLFADWRKLAYETERNEKDEQLFWSNYFSIEKGIYVSLLAEPEAKVNGALAELAKKYETSIQVMSGFLDGINDSLTNPNPVEDMTEETIVNLDFDKEKLYYNMVGATAYWLYELPAWENLLTPERRKELYLQQKKSNTIVKDKKTGRNDVCPCGSGKKYKKCCG